MRTITFPIKEHHPRVPNTMAAAVEREKKVPSDRKRQHSSELLQPPKGPGVSFIMQELGGKSVKRPCVSDSSLKSSSLNPPKTFKVDRSSVLGRVQSFLPQLKEADQELKQRLQSQPHGDLTDLDIENVEDGNTHIEMDLAVVPLLSSDSDSDLDSDALCSDSEPRTTCSVSSKIHAKCNKVSSCR